MALPNKPNYSHGSTGTEPASPKDYQAQDAVDAEHFDHFIYTPFEKIKEIIDYLSDVESGNVTAGNSKEWDGLRHGDGTNGQFLRTDGANANWETVDTSKYREVSIPLTSIGDTEHAIGLPKQLQSNQTLEIHEIGAEVHGGGSLPSGLYIEVEDVTNNTNIVSQNTRYASGSPITTYSTQGSLEFRVRNATGSYQKAGGFVYYTIV